MARRRLHLIDYYLIFIFKRSLREFIKKKEEIFFPKRFSSSYLFSVTDICRVLVSNARCVALRACKLLSRDSILIHFVRFFTRAKRVYTVQYHEAICNALDAIFRVVHARGHVRTGRVGSNDSPRASAPQCHGKDSIIAS